MPKFSYLRNLRTRLLLLACAIAIPLFAVFHYDGQERQLREEAEAEENALRIVRSAARVEEGSIDAARKLMANLASLPTTRSSDASVCNAFLADILKLQPEYTNLSVVRPDGELLCSAIPPNGAPNAIDKEWFQRVVQTREFVVGDYFVDAATDKPSLSLAYPVLNDSDEVLAVAVAALDLSRLSELASFVHLPAGSTFTVVDRQGTVLVRYPNPDGLVGQTLPGSVAREAMAVQRNEPMTQIEVEDENRMLLIAPLGRDVEPSGHILIAIPEEAIFAELRQETIRHFLMFGITFVLVLGVAWYLAGVLVLRPVRALMTATKRLGTGDLSARAELAYETGELGELAAAFNQMATSIGRHTTQIRESEIRFRKLAETAPAVILIYQGDKFVYANRAATLITGYSQTELLSMNFWEVAHPDERLLLWERGFARQQGIAVPSRYELKVLTKDGEERRADVAEGVIELDGKTAVIVSAYDITERKQAEEALQESERRYRELADLLPQTVFEIDMNGILTFINKTGVETFRGAQEDIEQGIAVLDYIASEDRARARDRIPRVIRGEVSGGSEYALIRKDGSRFPAMIFTSPIVREGQCVGARGIIIDLTESKRAEAALRDLERRTREMLQNLDVAALMLDMEGNITYCNDYLLERAGWDRDEVMGRSWFDTFLPSDIREEARSKFSKACETGQVTAHYESYIQTRHGERHLMSWSSTLLRDIQGEIVGVANIGEDITERQQTEDRLRYRVRWEGLIASISTRLINLAPDQINSEVIQALKQIGGFAGIDRGCIFTLTDDGRTLSNTQGWCVDGIEPQIHNLQRLPIETFPRWMEKLNNFEVICIPRVADLTAEADNEKELLQAQGIQSVIVVPMVYEGVLKGFLSFGSIAEEKTWAGEDVALLKMTGEIVVSALERGRAEEALKRYADQASILVKISQIIAQAGLGYQSVLNAVAEQIAVWLGDRCTIRLLSEDGQRLDPVAFHHVDESKISLMGELYRSSPMRSDEGFSGRVFQSGEAMLIPNISQEQALSLIKREHRPYVDQIGICSLLVVPLRAQGKVIGTIIVSRDRPGHPYTEDDKALLQDVADRAALAITNARLFEAAERELAERKHAEQELERSLAQLRIAVQGTTQALTKAAEARDPYTAGHQERTTRIACAIAEAMGLPGEVIEQIKIGGIIHDLGKMSVPAEILSKPSKLNSAEMSLIRTHPQVGYDILKGVEFPWPIAQVLLQHHERWDGSGYPNGLSGEDILLAARILAVADVVEAMASHRPYRPALGIDKALEEISRNSGVLYDPEVADTCVRLFAEGKIQIEDLQ